MTCPLEEVDEIILAATDVGASVRDVTFGLHEATHERHYDAALTDAMADARRKAETVAAAEEETVGEVVDISTSAVTDGHDLFDNVPKIGNVDEFEFDPGTITVEAAVEVVFGISE